MINRRDSGTVRGDTRVWDRGMGTYSGFTWEPVFWKVCALPRIEEHDREKSILCSGAFGDGMCDVYPETVL